MKIKDLREGLYFTLPTENFFKTYDLGNRYDKRSYSNQRYTYYTAVKYKDKWYMLNTYQLPYLYPDKATSEGYLKAIKDNQEQCYNEQYKYHYSCKVELTEDTLKLFDFEFDLRDYKIIKEEESRYYNYEDLIYISLYNEHNYLRGVILVNKKSKIDNKLKQLRIINNLADKTKYPLFNKYEYKNAVNEFNKIEDKEEEIIEEIKAYALKIKEFEEELETMNFKWIDTKSGRIKISKLNEFLEK